MKGISTRWRVALFLGLAAVAATGVLIRRRVGSRGPLGEVTADHSTIDVGEVAAERAGDIEARFRITNGTNRRVEITSVAQSCTCTSTSVARRVIGPGEASIITAHINWAGHRGGQMTSIIVHTEPPGLLQLRVIGALDAGVNVSPTELNLGVVEPDTVVKRLVAVGRTDQSGAHNGRFAVQRIHPSTDAIKAVEVDGRDRNDELSWFEVSIAADRLPAGENGAHIDIVPADPKLNEVTLPVRYVLGRRIKAMATAVRFNSAKSEARIVRFHLLHPETEAVNFTIADGLGNGSAHFTIKEVRRTPSPASDIDVVVEADTNPGAGVQEARLSASIGTEEAASVSLLRF
jgi:hypothetical protein